MDKGLEVTKYSYSESLNRYLKDLNTELDEITRNIANHGSFLKNLEGRQTEIKMEIDRVSERIREVNEAKNLSDLGMDGPLSTRNSEVLDATYAQKDQVAQDINKLEEAYNNADSASERMIITQKIRYKEQELAKLQKKAIRIGDRQRTIIAAKTTIERLKNKGTVKQELKVAKNEAKAEEIQRKIDNSPDNGGVVSTLIEKSREIRVSYYRGKADRAREILNKLDNRSFIKGARAIAIARVMGDKLKDRIKNSEQNELGKQEALADMVANPVQPTVEAAKVLRT